MRELSHRHDRSPTRARLHAGPRSVRGVRRVALAVLLALAACRAGAPADVEVEVRNVGFDHDAGAPVVILQARGDADRMLPIWIGPAEAQAIAMEMQHVTPPRPLTHDLMKRILESTGATLRRVLITKLEQQTFFATLVVDRNGDEVEIDSRPSDAIALALRVACPIFVRPALFGGAEGRPRGAAGKLCRRAPSRCDAPAVA